MHDRLTIFKLSIKSSYLKSEELPADDMFDTLQFYVHDDSIMRIRTYAVDHDIHMHLIPLRGRSISETLDFLISSTKEHYGDVIANEYTLELESPSDSSSAETFFRENEMNPQLVSENDYTYWNPDSLPYENKSNPLS